ncbi:OsmC family peroxiredoxin [Massilia arenosa]|uniref:OsmC family peroxiredoxin n=1 Tax=Zemynaea arenosa TaxID=2561931 RepID=A0A4Y9SGC5_9BURK|nr:OsmC family protein [Massilia arenosa]TFW22437.1 OsmC family peroxiredoxin [Massilia arenosa]
MSITVKRDLSQPMRHIVHVRDHIVSTDLELDEGGTDAGPNPHDLYDAALGACKALTLLWYAKRKNIGLTDIQVQVDRDNSQERQGVYKLATTIALMGDLTGAQREELLGVARKCPVHKLMSSVTTEITTELA